MDDFEALITTIDIVEKEVDRLIKNSLNEQRESAPVTTPTPYEINAMIGSSNLYSYMSNIEFNEISSKIVDEEISSGKEIYEDKMPERLEDAKNFRTYLTLLIYHFLANKDVELFPNRPPPLINSRDSKVMKKLDEDNFEWEAKIEDNPPAGISQEGEFVGYSLIWIYFLPSDTIKRIEKKIDKELRENEARVELIKALKQFPQGLNKLSRGKENFFFSLLRKFGSDTSEIEFEEFNRVFLHEITHDYLKKNTNTELQSKTVDEAFAQFTDKVYQDNLDFRHAPRSYKWYRKRYEYADPENIWWMVEIIREKAKTTTLDDKDYSIIDWARMTEAKIHNQNIESKIDFLEFFTPEKIRRELKEFNSIINNEIKPISQEIEENLLKIKNMKIDVSPQKKEKLRKVVKKSDADIEKLKDVLNSPDKVLRRIEKKQVGDRSKLGQFKNIFKTIEFYVAKNDKKIEYEQELVQKIIKEELKEIKSCINDFKQLRSMLVKHGEHQTAKNLAKDIKELESVGEDLEKIVSHERTRKPKS